MAVCIIIFLMLLWMLGYFLLIPIFVSFILFFLSLAHLGVFRSVFHRIIWQKCVHIIETDFLTVCPPLDQHRLQEWVRSLPGALTAARSALPSFCHRIYKCCSKVIDLHECHHQTIPYCKALCLQCSSTAWISPRHRLDSSKKSKSLGRKFHTCEGSKLENSQMVCKHRW